MLEQVCHQHQPPMRDLGAELRVGGHRPHRRDDRRSALRPARAGAAQGAIERLRELFRTYGGVTPTRELTREELFGGAGVFSNVALRPWIGAVVALPFALCLAAQEFAEPRILRAVAAIGLSETIGDILGPFHPNRDVVIHLRAADFLEGRRGLGTPSKRIADTGCRIRCRIAGAQE